MKEVLLIEIIDEISSGCVYDQSDDKVIEYISVGINDRDRSLLISFDFFALT